jgi:AcrR family transcriptional regulator
MPVRDSVAVVPAPPAPPALRGARRDAARSRRAILDAAERLLTARGGAVPMYEVARAAGVGQATLYRHFSDKTALVAAVLEERLEHLERVAAAHAGSPDCMVVLLREIAGQQASAAAILGVLRESGPEAMAELGGRVRSLIAGPVTAAVAAGRVRPDFGVDDFLMILSMVGGVLERGAEADRTRRWTRTLELVLEGVLRPAR